MAQVRVLVRFTYHTEYALRCMFGAVWQASPVPVTIKGVSKAHNGEHPNDGDNDPERNRCGISHLRTMVTISSPSAPVPWMVLGSIFAISGQNTSGFSSANATSLGSPPAPSAARRNSSFTSRFHAFREPTGRPSGLPEVPFSNAIVISSCSVQRFRYIVRCGLRSHRGRMIRRSAIRLVHGANERHFGGRPRHLG